MAYQGANRDLLGHMRHTAKLMGIGAIWGILLSIAPMVGSVVFQLTPINLDTPGLAQKYAEEAEAAAVLEQEAVLAEAAEVAALTEGMECWDPSTGRVGSQIVVRDTETEVVSVIPFTAEAYERATAGEFLTIKACEVA